MADDPSFPQSGIIVPGDNDLNDNMDELAHAILDDIVYNIIHDIVLKTHRDEKIARASSAAIRVEQLAAEADPAAVDGLADGSKSGKVETDAAIWKGGEVYLKGNPLKTTKEILCSKCGLPRLFYPTDGKGARKPEPGVEYCKRRPFIEKPYHDIYGQTFVPEGPGRGKKKKDMINPLKQQQTVDGDTPGGSQESGTSTPAEGKPIAFPHAKCHNCNTFLPIKRMNNHMVKCIGGGGRDSSRTALLKIQNGNGSGSQNGGTPPGSRHGTPLPGGTASQHSTKKSSPTKREADDELESDGTPQKKKKIIMKKAPSNLKDLKVNKLKAPKMTKTGSQQSTSNLSFEYKASNSDDDEDDVPEDENDGEYGGTVVVEPKKKQKIKLATAVKEKEAAKKKWLLGKGGVKLDPQKITPVLPPGVMAKKLASGGGENGHGHGATATPTNVKGGNKVANGDMESESSQTLSSPS
ncbi:hypothetical protein F5884DRAFT_274363 [Xylogone sp. PMI_703]|nr:hypothetical protein F5884DRAFT_274363 [Xylogone sp. PMI_703]